MSRPVDAKWRIRWDLATVDPGGTVFGQGPYLKVPVHCRACEAEHGRHRVYAPERLRKQLAKQWRQV